MEEIIVSSGRFKDPELIGQGGEGEIYELDELSVAKIYFECTEARKQKVLALCDSYKNFLERHGDCQVAFPEEPAYKSGISLENLVGFSMAKYKYPSIFDLRYDLYAQRFSSVDGFSFDDRSALKFVYDLFVLVEQLHQTRVVLGDVNSGNILCDPGSREPVIVDVDAAQVGGYPCWSTHRDYNDPRLEERGRTAGGDSMFDFGTDMFALAAVCFEFLIGALPHALDVAPPMLIEERKFLGISWLRSLTSGNGYLDRLSVAYYPCDENTMIAKRVRELSALDARLYNYFKSVFVDAERESLLFTLPISDERHPGYAFFGKPIAKPKSRKRRPASLGPSDLPDPGYRDLVKSSGSVPYTITPRPAMPRADPKAFKMFAERFDFRLDR